MRLVLISFYFRKSKIKSSQVIQTLLLRLSCKLNGIEIGRHSKTYGKTYLLKHPKSKISIGANVRFRSSFISNPVGLCRRNIISTLTSRAVIQIGNNCGFSGNAISCFEKIVIGDNVMVGANAVITDSDWHSINSLDRNTKNPETSPIEIGENVWIGMNAIILKGVKIGKNSVIGANSVVTKDIPENSIVAGNPARIIRSIEQ